MKKTLLILTIFLAMQACGPVRQADPFQLQTVVAGTLEALTQEPVSNPDTPLSPTSTLTQPTIIPATAALTDLPASANGAYPIQFDANGTYKDVVDDIQAGSSKTYSIRAMQGQVMSVSFWSHTSDANPYISMQITGADGQVLCPQENTDCNFWRGALPSSQDYFVALVSSGVNANFTLRVAINPPGQDTQSFQYINPSTGLSLTYPDTFAPTNGPFDGYITTWGNNKIEPGLLLHLIDTGMFINTNLSAVYLTAGSTSDAQMVATCANSNPSDLSEQSVGNEIVNGYTFVHTTASGVALGHAAEQNIYRMANNNICYEVIYHIQDFSIGNLTPGSGIVEFDKNAVIQELNGVFFTFKIN